MIILGASIFLLGCLQFFVYSQAKIDITQRYDKWEKLAAGMAKMLANTKEIRLQETIVEGEFIFTNVKIGNKVRRVRFEFTHFPLKNLLYQ